MERRTTRGSEGEPPAPDPESHNHSGSLEPHAEGCVWCYLGMILGMRYFRNRSSIASARSD